jgi:peptidoglycan/xylan/chitin deacetylase (PgdA/CDA1 family)
LAFEESGTLTMAIRRLALTVSRYSGAQRLFRLWSRGPTVLFYHGIEENILDREVQALHMSLRAFERQIAFVRCNREVVSMDYLYECIASGRGLDPRQVVLTFDDGYKNNLRVVAPLLNTWKLPFTIFVSSKHISEGRRFPNYYIRAAILYTRSESIHLRSIRQTFPLTTRTKRSAALATIIAAAKKAPQHVVDEIIQECREQLSRAQWGDLDAEFFSEEPMSWQDVRRVSEMGATIGSHCHDHCILHSNQNKEEVCRQLNQSKSTIEKNVAACRYMAYPNGTVDDISSVGYAAAKSAGYRIAFTSIPGEVTADVDRFFAPRIFATADFEEFCYLVNRTSLQNQVYTMARLQGGASSNQATIEPN